MAPGPHIKIKSRFVPRLAPTQGPRKLKPFFVLAVSFGECQAVHGAQAFNKAMLQ